MSVSGSSLTYGSAGAWIDAGIVAALVVGVYLFTMWLAAILWTWRDIRSRTQSLAARVASPLLVALFNVPGFLLYLLLRPQRTLEERAEIELEIDAFAREVALQPTCPECDRNVEQGFVACPYCRASLSTPCAECGRNLAFSWVLCPYCLATRGEGETAAALTQARSGRRRAMRTQRNPGRPQPAAQPAAVTVNRER